MREIVLQLDLETVLWLVIRRRARLDTVMRLITHLGDGPFWGILAMVLVLSGGEGQLLAELALAFGLEITLHRIIKQRVTRPRPFLVHPRVTGLVLPPDEYSFPSGHTAAGFVMAVVAGAAFPLLAPGLVVLALLIGVSRVYLGVHFPTDVLAGALLGIGSGCVALGVL